MAASAAVVSLEGIVVVDHPPGDVEFLRKDRRMSSLLHHGDVVVWLRWRRWW
jgi:hypothetical protein